MRLAVAALGLLAVMSSPAVAAAAVTVGVEGDPGDRFVVVDGTVGEDRITVSTSSSSIDVRDFDDAISVESGCTKASTTIARCTGSFDRVIVRGQAGADKINVIGPVRGRLFGDGGADELGGGDGKDDLFGAAGRDQLEGRGGDDVLDGGDDADTMSGGAGADTADYDDRSSGAVEPGLNAAAGLKVTLNDDLANDGNSADGGDVRDRVRPDVENVFGMRQGLNELVGSALPNRLIGGQQADVLRGHDGDDQLNGDRGADVLEGGAGDDVLDGGFGPDDMDGGAGDGDRVSYSTRTTPVNVVVQSSVAGEDGGIEDAGGGRRDEVARTVEEVDGGSAGDVISEVAVARGHSGDDTLFAASVLMEGGLGNDRLRPSFGFQTPGTVISGGPGRDTADYTGDPVVLSLSLDGQANDGAVPVGALPGSRDDIRSDVEELIGGESDDTISGNNSANVLRGGPGNDTLTGLGGADTLEGGAGTDTFSAGEGEDTALYTQGPVTVSLDAVANDGDQGQENVGTDFENVSTAGFGDTLIGDAGRNELRGGGGDDTIRGGGGNDLLEGQAGDDLVDGGEGSDSVNGGDGVDQYPGDPGDDLVLSIDGNAETVRCGDGNDLALVDLPDLGLRDCETVSRAAVREHPTVRYASRTARLRGGVVAVRLSCPRGQRTPCRGTLTLRRVGGRRLGAARFSIRRGRRATVLVRIGARRSGRSVGAVARERDRQGRPKTSTTTLTVRQ